MTQRFIKNLGPRSKGRHSVHEERGQRFPLRRVKRPVKAVLAAGCDSVLTSINTLDQSA